MKKPLYNACVVLSEHLKLNAIITNDWRAIKVGHLISITPDVVLNKDLLEYMEHPPRGTMVDVTWFLIWIQLSIAIII